MRLLEELRTEFLLNKIHLLGAVYKLNLELLILSILLVLAVQFDTTALQHIAF